MLFRSQRNIVMLGKTLKAIIWCRKFIFLLMTVQYSAVIIVLVKIQFLISPWIDYIPSKVLSWDESRPWYENWLSEPLSFKSPIKYIWLKFFFSCHCCFGWNSSTILVYIFVISMSRWGYILHGSGIVIILSPLEDFDMTNRNPVWLAIKALRK